MPEGWSLEGNIEALVSQIESGEAAEGYARLQISNEQRLREMAEAAGRVSFPLHTRCVAGAPPPEADSADSSRPFKVRLKAMLRRAGLIHEEGADARA